MLCAYEYSSFSSVEHGTVSARHTPHIRSNQVISSPDVAPVTHARCLTHSCSRASHIRKTDIGHKGPYARCHGSAAATYCSPLLRYSSAECEIATEEREIMGVGSNAVCVVIVCRVLVRIVCRLKQLTRLSCFSTNQSWYNNAPARVVRYTARLTISSQWSSAMLKRTVWAAQIFGSTCGLVTLCAMA